MKTNDKLGESQEAPSGLTMSQIGVKSDVKTLTDAETVYYKSKAFAIIKKMQQRDVYLSDDILRVSFCLGLLVNKGPADDPYSFDFIKQFVRSYEDYLDAV